MPVLLEDYLIVDSVINSSRSYKCIAEGVLRSFVFVVEGVVKRNHQLLVLRRELQIRL